METFTIQVYRLLWICTLLILAVSQLTKSQYCPVTTADKCQCVSPTQCFLFAKQHVYWREAEASCFAYGGHLVKPNTEELRNQMVSIINSDNFNWFEVWLGGIRATHDWKWAVVSGPLLTPGTGCFGLTHSTNTQSSVMRMFPSNHPQLCVTFCRRQPITYQYALLKGQECRCVLDMLGYQEVRGVNCHTVCQGKFSAFCGGNNHYSGHNISGSSFMKWSEYHIGRGNTHENCVYLQKKGLESSWYSGQCMNQNRFICQYSASVTMGMVFEFSKQEKTWHEAKIICESNGAILAETPHKLAADHLTRVVPDGTRYWVGLSRESVVWTNSLPSSATPSQQCLALTSKVAFAWENCNRWMQYICELDNRTISPQIGPNNLVGQVNPGIILGNVPGTIDLLPPPVGPERPSIQITPEGVFGSTANQVRTHLLPTLPTEDPVYQGQVFLPPFQDHQNTIPVQQPQILPPFLPPQNPPPVEPAGNQGLLGGVRIYPAQNAPPDFGVYGTTPVPWVWVPSPQQTRHTPGLIPPQRVTMANIDPVQIPPRPDQRVSPPSQVIWPADTVPTAIGDRYSWMASTQPPNQMLIPGWNNVITSAPLVPLVDPVWNTAAAAAAAAATADPNPPSGVIGSVIQAAGTGGALAPDPYPGMSRATNGIVAPVVVGAAPVVVGASPPVLIPSRAGVDTQGWRDVDRRAHVVGNPEASAEAEFDPLPLFLGLGLGFVAMIILVAIVIYICRKNCWMFTRSRGRKSLNTSRTHSEQWLVENHHGSNVVIVPRDDRSSTTSLHTNSRPSTPRAHHPSHMMEMDITDHMTAMHAQNLSAGNISHGKVAYMPRSAHVSGSTTTEVPILVPAKTSYMSPAPYIPPPPPLPESTRKVSAGYGIVSSGPAHHDTKLTSQSALTKSNVHSSCGHMSSAESRHAEMQHLALALSEKMKGKESSIDEFSDEPVPIPRHRNAQYGHHKQHLKGHKIPKHHSVTSESMLVLAPDSASENSSEVADSMAPPSTITQSLHFVAPRSVLTERSRASVAPSSQYGDTVISSYPVPISQYSSVASESEDMNLHNADNNISEVRLP